VCYYSGPTTPSDLTLLVGFFLLSRKQCSNSSSRRDPGCEMSSSCEMPCLWAGDPVGKSRAGRQCKKSVMPAPTIHCPFRRPELSGCRIPPAYCGKQTFRQGTYSLAGSSQVQFRTRKLSGCTYNTYRCCTSSALTQKITCMKTTKQNENSDFTQNLLVAFFVGKKTW